MKEIAKIPFRVGRVALVGRPNVGKSTLLNALVGQKVAIVTPKPQTTQAPIEAFFEDERGQIFFLDTPGFFASNRGVKRYNLLIKESINEADVIAFVVDKTRDWGEEDERVWVMVEAAQKPTVLIINKIDLAKPDYTDAYIAIVSPKVAQTVKVSSQTRTHLKAVLNALFAVLPEGKRITSVDNFVTPLLSQSSSEFLAEIIREKIYLSTGEEVPYQTHVRVTDIQDEDELFSLKGTVFVTEKRYLPILIGKGARKIKEISDAVKKELKVVTNKEVSVRLKVQVAD